MLFFVVPFTGQDPIASTYATASMVTFAVMTTNLFQYGIGVAEDRAQPWDPFTRSLPAGPAPRFLGRILAGLVLMTISLIPVVVIAALFTAATITPGAFLAAVGATAVAAVPFILMGLGIGYSLPSKAAIVVAQVLFFPLAFGGGLMTAPALRPDLSRPSRRTCPPAGRYASCGRRSVTTRSTCLRWSRSCAGLSHWPLLRYGPIDATKVGGSARTWTLEPGLRGSGATMRE